MGRREAWSADRSSDSRTKPTRWEFRGRRHANKALAASTTGHDNRGNTIGDDEDDDERRGGGGGGGGGGDGSGGNGGRGRELVGVSEKKTMTDGGSGKTKDQTVKIRLVRAPMGVATNRLVVVRY